MNMMSTAAIAPKSARLTFSLPDPNDVELLDAQDFIRDRLAKAAASPFGVHSEPVAVTHIMAKAFLNGNDGNRNIRMDAVRKFMDDMKQGRWELNGESVIVARTGELNDGQHRLLAIAILEAVNPIPLMITFGATRASNKTVDQGKNRTGADIFTFEGYKHSTILSGMTRMVVAFEAEGPHKLGDPGLFTWAQALARLKADEAKGLNLLTEAAEFAVTTRKSAMDMISPTLIAFCFWAIVRRNGTEGRRFMDSFANQTMIAPDTAIHNMSRWLKFHHGDKNTDQHRQQKVEMVFKGWNAHRRDQRLAKTFIENKLPALKQ